MKLKENLWFVGVQNPGLRVFDIIMETKYGTSYNAYLVKGDKYALIEAAHEDYAEEFIENIEEIVPVEEIDYIILNHTEPDHSGNLIKLLEKNPNLQVVGTTAAIKNLGGITNQPLNSRVVKDKEVLDLGQDVVLEFITAPNLHWPDSMFTYWAGGEVLFSCDVFGSHYCEPRVLDKYVKLPEAFVLEQKNYFDCIFGPFKNFVRSGMKKLEDKNISMICNSHGPVLVEGLKDTWDRYEQWSQEEEQEKTAAIFYVSSYGYTKTMADALAAGIAAAGVNARVYDLVGADIMKMAHIMNEAAGVLFGSCTINRAALPPVMSLIAMTEAIQVKNKPAMSFGSYGWSGEACAQMDAMLSAYKYKVAEGIKIVFKPSEEDINGLKEAGSKFAALL